MPLTVAEMAHEPQLGQPELHLPAGTLNPSHAGAAVSPGWGNQVPIEAGLSCCCLCSMQSRLGPSHLLPDGPR
jgi:hypothetical protein